MASAGNGGPTHLAGEVLKSLAHVNIVHIPYKGNAAALTDLVGGEAQMMFSNLLTSMPHVRTGRLRVIAVSTAKRSPQAPELPTIAESGVPGYDVTPWYGILGPADLPRAIVAKLNRESRAWSRCPKCSERFVAQGIDLASSTPERSEPDQSRSSAGGAKSCANRARAPTDSVFRRGRELRRLSDSVGRTFRPKPCALLRRPPQ